MHPGANTGQSCCTLSACRAADSGAEQGKRSATRRRQSAHRTYGSSSARRRASRGSPTRGHKRPRHSGSPPPPSTDRSCPISRRCRQDPGAGSFRSTNSSASWPSEGNWREQSAGSRQAVAASRVFLPRSSRAFVASTRRALAWGRSHVTSLPTVWGPRRVVVSGGRRRCGPFSSAQLRLNASRAGACSRGRPRNSGRADSERRPGSVDRERSDAPPSDRRLEARKRQPSEATRQESPAPGPFALRLRIELPQFSESLADLEPRRCAPAAIGGRCTSVLPIRAARVDARILRCVGLHHDAVGSPRQPTLLVLRVERRRRSEDVECLLDRPVTGEAPDTYVADDHVVGLCGGGRDE